jgi:hypothetical protein
MAIQVCREISHSLIIAFVDGRRAGLQAQIPVCGGRGSKVYGCHKARVGVAKVVAAIVAAAFIPCTVRLAPLHQAVVDGGGGAILVAYRSGGCVRAAARAVVPEDIVDNCGLLVSLYIPPPQVDAKLPEKETLASVGLLLRLYIPPPP